MQIKEAHLSSSHTGNDWSGLSDIYEKDAFSKDMTFKASLLAFL